MIPAFFRAAGKRRAFRPYHSAVSLDVVVSKITSMGKKQLDPEVVSACIRVIDRGEFKPAYANDLAINLGV
jgi:response regulator RpfG family c-di-GMP phosphodiesterase